MSQVPRDFSPKFGISNPQVTQERREQNQTIISWKLNNQINLDYVIQPLRPEWQSNRIQRTLHIVMCLEAHKPADYWVTDRADDDGDFCLSI